MTSFTQLRTDHIKELPGWLVRYDAALLEVTASELRDYLLALVNALFFKATKQEELFDAVTAKQALTDAKRLQSLLGVAESALGTHNLKYPNANVGQGAVFGQAEVNHPANYPWVSSLTTRLTRTVGGAGNAAWAAEIRFLCTEFLLEGERTRMADVLATREGKVWEVLQTLGLQQTDADKIGRVLHQRLNHPDKGAIDHLSKQVFFPIREGEDVVITPVQHLGLAREFHARFFQRISKDNPRQERLNVRALKVGGANPINAGPYNAELGGLYRHLLAEAPPPKRSSANEAEQFDDHAALLLARLRQRYTVFPSPQQLELDVTLFDADALPKRAWRKGISCQKSHIENRLVFEQAADALARQLLQDACHLAEWLALQADSPLTEAAFDQVAVLEKAWLDPRLRAQQRLGANQVEVLVSAALALFEQCKNHYKLDDKGEKQRTAHALSKMDKEMLQGCLETLIKEF